MPKGVEHQESEFERLGGRDVRTAVMPKGVEHGIERTIEGLHARYVRTAVMPKGVEHAYTGRTLAGATK